MTILLVEDEEDSRTSLAKALERDGLVVAPAGDVATAKAILASGPRIELGVLDLRLGDDDRGGLTVLEAMRPTPAVMVTAFADLDRVKEALNLGATFLLEKPFRAADLVRIVREQLAARHDLGALVQAALGAASLTAREDEIARLVLKGLPSAEIATLLGMSDKTVRQHLTHIYDKCGVTSRAELFHFVFPF